MAHRSHPFSLIISVSGRSGLLPVHIWGPVAAPKAEGWEVRLLGEFSRGVGKKMDKTHSGAEVTSECDSETRRE